MNTKLHWNTRLSFSAETRGHASHFDTTEEDGGDNSAPSPKEALLNSMCACSGMDIIQISKKMHIQVSAFSMEASAEKSSTIPSYFSKVHMKYFITGDQEVEKFIKTVVFSMTKYCGVSYMISKVCPITYEVYLNEQLIYEDKAQFTLEVV